MSGRRDWMVEARKRHNKSITDVAADLGVTRQTIYRLEAGETDKTHADIISYYRHLCREDGVDIPDDIVMYEQSAKHNVTASELRDVVLNERKIAGCYSLSCDGCKWYDEKASCDYAIIADYVNKIRKENQNEQ